MRIRKPITAICFALLAGLSSMTGCADNRTTLYIERALYIPEGGDCKIGVDLDGRQSGVMDLTLTKSYGVPVVMANQMQPLGDPDRLRAETSIIQLEGFEVSIEGLDNPATNPSYSRRFTAVVNPGTGTEPGRAPIYLDLIPSGAITEPGSYLINVIVYGTTLGGLGVESPEFTFPLQVCEDCLLSCDEEAGPACAADFGSDYYHYCAAYPQGYCSTYCGL